MVFRASDRHSVGMSEIDYRCRSTIEAAPMSGRHSLVVIRQRREDTITTARLALTRQQCRQRHLVLLNSRQRASSADLVLPSAFLSVRNGTPSAKSLARPFLDIRKHFDRSSNSDRSLARRARILRRPSEAQAWRLRYLTSFVAFERMNTLALLSRKNKGDFVLLSRSRKILISPSPYGRVRRLNTPLVSPQPRLSYGVILGAVSVGCSAR